jgi:hypothetical protein
MDTEKVAGYAAFLVLIKCWFYIARFLKKGNCSVRVLSFDRHVASVEQFHS